MKVIDAETVSVDWLLTQHISEKLCVTVSSLHLYFRSGPTSKCHGTEASQGCVYGETT